MLDCYVVLLLVWVGKLAASPGCFGSVVGLMLDCCCFGWFCWSDGGLLVDCCG